MMLRPLVTSTCAASQNACSSRQCDELMSEYEMAVAHLRRSSKWTRQRLKLRRPQLSFTCPSSSSGLAAVQRAMYFTQDVREPRPARGTRVRHNVSGCQCCPLTRRPALTRTSSARWRRPAWAPAAPPQSPSCTGPWRPCQT